MVLPNFMTSFRSGVAHSIPAIHSSLRAASRRCGSALSTAGHDCEHLAANVGALGQPALDLEQVLPAERGLAETKRSAEVRVTRTFDR